MRSNRHNILTIVPALMMLLYLSSCTQELCYDHYPTLEVNFEWEKEWERDYGEYHLDNWNSNYFECEYTDLHPGEPEWVNMIRYFEDESHIEHFLSPEGNKYIVEAGKESSMLLYNGDTEYIVISDVASLNDARAIATTRTRSSAAMQSLYQTHQGSRTTNPPDVLYSAFINSVAPISNHEVRHFDVRMQPLVYTYVIMYEFDKGLEHVVLSRGAIGGMAEAVYLRTGVTSEETSIILFDCELCSKGCIAKVHAFGAPGFPDKYYGRTVTTQKDREYTLNLELRLRSGKTVAFNYDISDQLKNQPRGGVIKITGIEVEDSEPTSSSGFDVDLTDWDDTGEIIDLPFGNQNR